MPKLNLVLNHYTDEERVLHEELKAKEQALDNQICEINMETEAGRALAEELSRESQNCFFKQYELYELALNRYIESFKDNPERVLEDVRKVVRAVNREDFLNMLENRRRAYEDIDSLDVHMREMLGEDFKERLRKGLVENFNNYIILLASQIDAQLAVVEAYDIDRSKVNAILDDVAGQFYENNEPEDFKDAEIAVTFIRPKEHMINLTKANRKIFSNSVTAQQLKQVSFDVSPTRGRNKTPALFMVNVDLKGIESNENLTEFDGGVFNSIVSVIAVNTAPVFTAKQIATHYYYGDNPSNSNPSQQQVGAVTKSIEKMRKADILIDYTDHMRLNGKLKEGERYAVEDYFLPCKKHYITTNGNTFLAYELKNLPPLQVYAEDVNQIGRTDSRALNVPVNLDETKAVIRDYILREVSIKDDSICTIKTDTLLAVGGLDPDSSNYRTKRKRIMDAVDKMLAYWKSEKIIQSYSYTKRNKSIVKINIKRKRNHSQG